MSTAWPEVPLGGLVHADKPRLADHLELPIASMTRSRGFVPQNEIFTKQVAGRNLSKYLKVSPNQLVVGIHIDEGAVGVSFLSGDYIVSPAYKVWTISNLDRVFPPYLDRYIRSPKAVNYFIDNYRNTADRRGNLTQEAFLELAIPLPPIEEQRRIAAVLDKVDKVRAKRRAALALLDTLAESIFLDMFGDPVANPMAWPSASLSELVSMPLRNGVSPANSGEIVESVLTLAAITGPTFRADAMKQAPFTSSPPQAKRVDSDDLLICRGNGNLGLVGRGHFPTKDLPDVIFPDTMIAARVPNERMNRAYLGHLWNSPTVRRQIKSLARTTNGTFKVNQEMLEGIRLLDPPAALQLTFAQRLDGLVSTRMKSEKREAALDELFASLQARAFKGEL